MTKLARRTIERAVRMLAHPSGADFDRGLDLLVRVELRGSDARAVSRVLDGLRSGDAAQVETAIAELCARVGMVRPTFAPANVIGSDVRFTQGPVAPLPPQPKATKRHVDATAIATYVAEHPRCEVVGCGQPPCPEPHHLISRQRKGPDVAENLIRLCVEHHMLWHTIGGKQWLKRLSARLLPEAVVKVMRALRIV